MMQRNFYLLSDLVENAIYVGYFSINSVNRSNIH